MRKCPSCGRWTMEFDNYFGRFRCYNPECNWMPISSTQQEIELIQAHEQPKEIFSHEIKNLQLRLSVFYDEINDVLHFKFGSNESTLDLPELDGRMVWKVGRRTGSITGFSILCAKKFVSAVRVNIETRLACKEEMEEYLRREPDELKRSHPSNLLIEKVIVTTYSSQKSKNVKYNGQLLAFIDKGFSKFEEQYAIS